VSYRRELGDGGERRVVASEPAARELTENYTGLPLDY
jgi:hypothetical protein